MTVIQAALLGLLQGVAEFLPISSSGHLVLARALMNVPGKLPDALLAEARDVGLSDENLVDLTMAMATIYFTNLTNHINDSISSLPPASDLVD